MARLVRKFGQALIIVLLLTGTAHAGKISAPPPLKDVDVSLQHYLKQIYDNFHKLEVTEDNPDGSRNGKKGECLILQTGGNSYLECNTDGSTTWLGVILTDTP